MPYTRRLVIASLGCTSWVALTQRLSFGFAASGGIELDTITLRSLVADPLHARGLGHSYRAQYPEEDHPNVLTGLIRSSLTAGDTAAAPPTRAALLSALERHVRAEFGSGDVVRVEGWVLARTEARLFALCE
jgi:hypothetical protein